MRNYDNQNEEIRTSIINIRALETTNPNKARRTKEKLIISLKQLVYSAIFRYKNFDNYDDLYQEGMIGLISAIEHFNTDLTFHFVRYAMWWIKSRISRSIKKYKMTIQGDACNIYFDYDISCIDPENEFLSTEQILILHESIKQLSPEQQTILNSHYGIMTEQISLQKIGNKFSLTRERIRQIESNALSKLKHKILK